MHYVIKMDAIKKALDHDLYLSRGNEWITTIQGAAVFDKEGALLASAKNIHRKLPGYHEPEIARVRLLLEG